ncbi:hypothetical protein EDC01DRAFT_31725 [Geopyxis carbonaria]|nr:hypothetical protein EDC01DRAFT_31725 [Geopyxis carbonaria]
MTLAAECTASSWAAGRVTYIPPARLHISAYPIKPIIHHSPTTSTSTTFIITPTTTTTKMCCFGRRKAGTNAPPPTPRSNPSNPSTLPSPAANSPAPSKAKAPKPKKPSPVLHPVAMPPPRSATWYRRAKVRCVDCAREWPFKGDGKVGPDPGFVCDDCELVRVRVGEARGL